MKIKNERMINILEERLKCLKDEMTKDLTMYQIIETEMIEREIARLKKSNTKLNYLLYRKEQIIQSLNRINSQIIKLDCAVPRTFLDFRDELARELNEVEKRIQTF